MPGAASVAVLYTRSRRTQQPLGQREPDYVVEQIVEGLQQIRAGDDDVSTAALGEHGSQCLEIKEGRNLLRLIQRRRYQGLEAWVWLEAARMDQRDAARSRDWSQRGFDFEQDGSQRIGDACRIRAFANSCGSPPTRDSTLPLL